MEDIQEDIQRRFFDFNEECPDEILNCSKIREEYSAEIERYKTQGICGGCIERSLRNKYATIILSSIKVA